MMRAESASSCGVSIVPSAIAWLKPWIEVRGVLSSWEASARNWRRVRCERFTSWAMLLKAVASRPTSSRLRTSICWSYLPRAISSEARVICPRGPEMDRDRMNAIATEMTRAMLPAMLRRGRMSSQAEVMSSSGTATTVRKRLSREGLGLSLPVTLSRGVNITRFSPYSRKRICHTHMEPTFSVPADELSNSCKVLPSRRPPVSATTCDVALSTRRRRTLRRSA